ncbi:hypothetical protein CPSG_00537 [Coccidioides posadasii str. Silveira]|uniref:Uncharacterized protein n=1 Tax=Coccidioides posadasii (strain RMSCC 757 / Silveira) TaxID=443226 RepID=E9CSH8_COCPS|nr:hypothetical protein CPSG_00537 [Coccidioides posadasii str. Silveira]
MSRSRQPGDAWANSQGTENVRSYRQCLVPLEHGIQNIPQPSVGLLPKNLAGSTTFNDKA